MKREEAPPEYWTLYRIAYLIDACSTKIGELVKLKDELQVAGFDEVMIDNVDMLVNDEIEFKDYLQRLWDELVRLPEYRKWSGYFEQ